MTIHSMSERCMPCRGAAGDRYFPDPPTRQTFQF
jgi:hypothetical protein